MYEPIVTRHLRPRVKMVPMQRNENTGPQITKEQLIAALEVPTSERTDQQIDTILLSLGQWKCFTSTVKSEQIRREICRHAVLEVHEANTILFRQDDPPNGWYIIVSGECHVIIMTNNDYAMHDMNIEMVKTLKKELGEDKMFMDVYTAGPKSGIGDTALIQNKARNATIYVAQRSELVLVESQVYRDTAAFFQKMQLQKRANLFSTVSEFQFIKDDPESAEIFSRLSENSTEFNIEPGTIIDLNHPDAITVKVALPANAKDADIAKAEELKFQKTQSLYVVAEGKMSLSRSVNFALAEKKEEKKVILSKAVEARKKLEAEILKVNKPSGVHSVQVAMLQAGSLFPDPRLKGDWVKYQFSLKVIEPVVLHCIRISDLYLALPLTILEKIMAAVRDQPSDEEVINKWIEKQKQIVWNTYKQKCVKEARRNVKVQKQVKNGDYGLRRACLPKAIKHHNPAPLHHNHGPSFTEDYTARRGVIRSPKRPATSLY